MESKIKVEHDFGSGQTWLQLYVSAETKDGAQPDLRDLALKAFVEKATYSHNEIVVVYPSSNQDNSVVQICVKENKSPIDSFNWTGLNAKCLKEVNSNFKKGQSYNLIMAIGKNNRVYVKGSGHIVRTQDEMDFDYLYEFAQAWEINDIGRYDVGEK